MKIPCLIFLFFGALMLSSCSKRRDTARENTISETDADKTRETHGDSEKEKPEPSDIGEDCVGFVRATVANRTDAAAQCPVCPSSATQTEVLQFDSFKVEKIGELSPDGTSCEAMVSITAHFNPSNGGTITGGLVGWIPAEQRTQYTRGLIPSGQQVYHVTITYRRDGDEWQAADFERR